MAPLSFTSYPVIPLLSAADLCNLFKGSQEAAI
jgi:hypothetical protein